MVFIRTDDNYYSKMVQFYDINYQLAQNDDKAAIFENYCEFLNSFDSSVEVQITFLNQQVNFDEYAKILIFQSRMTVSMISGKNIRIC